MGQQRIVSCEICEFSDIVTIGGSRSDYLTNDPFPCFCANCDELASTNRRITPRTCKKCGSENVLEYGEATRKPEGSSDASFDDNKEELHKCPNCKQYGFSLGPAIMFFD